MFKRTNQAIIGIGLHDRRFELAHKVVTHEKGHKVMLPVLSHKRHSKEQYMSLCKAADLFYSDSSPNTVEFDEDVLQKLLHVVDMLQKHNFLSNSLAAKAKEFVMKGDKYIVYALYKYDTNFDSLEAYLRYKTTDDERIQKEVGRTQQMLKRRKRYVISIFDEHLKQISCVLQQPLCSVLAVVSSCLVCYRCRCVPTPF